MKGKSISWDKINISFPSHIPSVAKENKYHTTGKGGNFEQKSVMLKQSFEHPVHPEIAISLEVRRNTDIKVSYLTFVFSDTP